MTNCNQIKRLIDETEQPEVMPFEASHHLNACASCRMFADERASLIALLNGIPRVNAPINFDAQLKARINTAKAKPAFSWLSPALYLRFGAASAALLIAVFVAQYNGLFSLTNQTASTVNPSAPALASGQIATLPGSLIKENGEAVTPSLAHPGPTQVSKTFVASTNRGNRRVPQVPAKAVDNSMPAEGSDLLVRPSSERDVEVGLLAVSLGAQPNMNRVDAKQKLVNRSGRTSRPSGRALVQQPVAFTVDL